MRANAEEQDCLAVFAIDEFKLYSQVVSNTAGPNTIQITPKLVRSETGCKGVGPKSVKRFLNSNGCLCVSA